MKSIDPEWVRALVRRALEEELGMRDRSTPVEAPTRDHPSHLEIASGCGSEADLSPSKTCLIEPHRLCSNSGYCKKLGF